MVKLMIFDFFDVFRTDSYKAWLAANNLKREGDYAEASELADAGKLTTEEFYQLISNAIGHQVTPQELDANATVNEEMVSFAVDLKQHYRTCLLSNAPSDFVRMLLKDHDLNRLFDDIFISSEIGHIKPHADAFHYVLQATGVDAADALFIDDNLHNVESAQNIGIQAVQFTSVDNLRKDLAALGIHF